MNDNIDLTKILKNCPEGFPLYSTIYGDVTFSRIINNDIQFIYSYKTSYGTYKYNGYVNLKGNPSDFYNGECTLFPSKEQRDWNTFTATWYKKDKFNPKTLKPFEKVIVSDLNHYHWKCDLFSHIIEDADFPYKCITSCYRCCIPYNDDTKHIVGTLDEAPEYYRYWED